MTVASSRLFTTSIARTTLIGDVIVDSRIQLRRSSSEGFCALRAASLRASAAASLRCCTPSPTMTPSGRTRATPMPRTVAVRSEARCALSSMAKQGYPLTLSSR
jgi:hypothetical protein